MTIFKILEAKENLGEVKLEVDGLGEVPARVREHPDLSFGLLIFAPSRHYEGIVHGDAKYLLDALGLKLKTCQKSKWPSFLSRAKRAALV